MPPRLQPASRSSGGVCYPSAKRWAKRLRDVCLRRGPLNAADRTIWSLPLGSHLSHQTRHVSLHPIQASQATDPPRIHPQSTHSRPLPASPRFLEHQVSNPAPTAHSRAQRRTARRCVAGPKARGRSADRVGSGTGRSPEGSQTPSTPPTHPNRQRTAGDKERIERRGSAQ